MVPKAVVKDARQSVMERLERRELFTGVPAHVTLAEQLVANIPAANNQYAYGTPTVTWAGLSGATSYYNASDCSTYQISLLEQAYGFTPSQISGWTGKTLPQVKDLYAAAEADDGFTGFTQIANVQIGDMIFIYYPTSTTDTGHCMMFDSLPVISSVMSGMQTYTVNVIDCTGTPHANDTRKIVGGVQQTGVGKGTIRLYTDFSGNLTGFAWSSLSGWEFENASNGHDPVFAKMPPLNTSTGTNTTYLAVGSQATWNSSTSALAVSGPSSVIADPSAGSNPMVTATGTGTQLLLMPAVATVVHMGSLSVTNGATAVAYDPSGGNVVLDIAANSTNGTVTVDSTSQLDLGTNDMLIHGGSLSTITAEIGRGFNAGKWNGKGIDSSAAAADSNHLTALGVIQNSSGSAVLYPSFDGFLSYGNDVLVRHTYYGDTNLDGKVDGTDYSRIDNGYQMQSTANPLTGWFNGDFNYDGVINGSDYTLIDNTFNQQGSQITFSTAAIVADTQPRTLPTLAASTTTTGDGDKRKKIKAGNNVIQSLNL